MSSNKSLILAALMLAGTAQADELKCPPMHSGKQLSSASVFNGPPEELSDLIPDKSKGKGDHAISSWNVATIYEAGRKVYLVCKYGPKESITVTAEKKVSTCFFRTHPANKPVEMFCK